MTSQGSKPVAGVTIAADPRVIPMGSRVQVAGAGEYSGIYTVSDTGGAIKGRKLDIFVNSREEALQFGRKQVYVAVLSVPRITARAKRKPAVETASCKACGRKHSDSIVAVRTGDRGGDSAEARALSTGSSFRKASFQ
jgi:hypothetical protein